MNRSDISDGIMLFQYSNTGRQGGRAQAVTQILWGLYRRNEIGFHNLGPVSLHGTWQVRSGHDLRINTAYIDNLPSTARFGALSLLLVHESVHATVGFAMLYSEIAARMLPIHYFRELSGPGVFNEATDPPQPGQRTQTVRLPPGCMPDYDKQSAVLSRDQLIDHVLSIKDYTTSAYLTPQWIIDNLANWHGLGNRRPRTRGLYIRVLAAHRADSYFTRAILDIMESVNTRADWDAMMAESGSFRTIQIALDDLSAQSQYSQRVIALERRWGVHLRDEPPPRSHN
jgi:hypothetical protein